MEFTGRVQTVTKDMVSGKYLVTFTVNENSAIEEVKSIQDIEKLTIKAVKHRQRRSLDANALLWVCLGKIAETLRTDKWNVYLKMLRRYGQFTYVCVKPGMVEAVKTQWRECEEIGKIDINGQEAIQLLCYFGSHTYNTKEFSTLLDGVISEMKELGIQTPTTEEMRRSLEIWEAKNGSEQDNTEIPGA